MSKPEVRYFDVAMRIRVVSTLEEEDMIEQLNLTLDNGDECAIDHIENYELIPL